MNGVTGRDVCRDVASVAGGLAVAVLAYIVLAHLGGGWVLSGVSAVALGVSGAAVLQTVLFPPRDKGAPR